MSPGSVLPCVMRRRCLAGAAALALVAPAGFVQAQSVAAGTANNPACKLAAAGSGTVASVIDGRTLALDDGREGRLAAIEVAPPGAAPGADAKQALAALVGGQTIALRGAGSETDRYGRTVAH